METRKELLRILDLPIFGNEEELASLMHITPQTIIPMVHYNNRFYKKYNKKKASGKWRRIRQPSKELKAVQAWILRNILEKIPTGKYATGYVKGKNIYDNVLPHCSNRYFISLDLEEFFPSISAKRIMKKFSIIGYSNRASYILSRLCTCERKLPQGAVTSPALSNWIASQLDRRIGGYAAKVNAVYTRYSDDITLSSNNRVLLRKSLSRIIKIIKREHFTPNLSKLRLLGPGKRCSITGLIKHDTEEHFSVGNKKKRQMRAIMHHYVFGSDTDTKYSNEDSIYGWIQYLQVVDQTAYDQMNQYLNKLIDKSTAS